MKSAKLSVSSETVTGFSSTASIVRRAEVERRQDLVAARRADDQLPLRRRAEDAERDRARVGRRNRVSDAGLPSNCQMPEPNVPSCSEQPVRLVVAELQHVDAEDRAPAGEQRARRVDLARPRRGRRGARCCSTTTTSEPRSSSSAPAPNSSDRSGSAISPTIAKTSAASMMTRGGPSRVMSGIASRQPSPAPRRSAK